MSQHDASGSTKSIRGDGMEIARHVFGKDWSMSPLGDMKDWPQNLKFATNLCLSSHMPIAVWWSSDFIIIYNDAFRSLMGLSDSGALGIGGSNVLPQIWKNLEPSLLATFKQSGPTQVEIEIASPRRGASKAKIVNFYNSPLFLDNGLIGGVLTSAVETSSLAIIEELKRSEERYTKMTEEVQDYAIILLDKDGTILNWNKGAQNIKGYTEEEIVGKNFSVFYLEDDRRNKLPEKLIQTAAEHGRAVHEGLRKRKDGTTFLGSIVITALHDINNEVIGFTKVTRDLTERKQAEDKIIQHATELEVKNKQLEQFAYIASHDLQEPLRKIQTFVQVIQAKMDDEDARNRYFKKIETSAKRMGDLIQSVLNYSRLSQMAEIMVPVDLNYVLKSVLSDYELFIEEKHAVIHADPLPVVHGIELQLGQLFSNLVGNSLKFSQGQPEISISHNTVHGRVVRKLFNSAGSSETYHELTFKDNGIGFEQQYAEKIFTIFQRLNSREEYAGTGIGLALCKKIAENHNGYIYAKSELGQGATFFVYLPSK